MISLFPGILRLRGLHLRLSTISDSFPVTGSVDFIRRLGIAVTTIRPRFIAFTGLSLMLAPFLSFAQTGTAASQDVQPAAQDQKPPLKSQDQSTGQSESPNQQTKPPADLPNAPSSSKTEPSLEDLGFSASQAQGDAKQQALLDKRTHMLKIHQRLGLITTIPLIATVATSLNAGGKNTSTAPPAICIRLSAGLTGDLYFMTAYYAIRAPRVPEPKLAVRSVSTRPWLGSMARE